MANKPTGVGGSFSVRVDDQGNAIAEHRKRRWPSDQKEIERIIFDLFREKMTARGVNFSRVVDGGTHDLDYRVTTIDDEFDVELMEIVVPSGKGVPFRRGHATFTAGEYVDAVSSPIQRKVSKYGLNHEKPIDLVLYATHDTFNPSQAAFELLTNWFHQQQHSFRNVYYVWVLGDFDGALWDVYVRGTQMPTLSAPFESLRKTTSFHVDFSVADQSNNEPFIEIAIPPLPLMPPRPTVIVSLLQRGGVHILYSTKFRQR